jgi:hypothetical protein
MAKLTFILGSLEALHASVGNLVLVASAAASLGFQLTAFLSDDQTSTLDKLNIILEEKSISIVIDSTALMEQSPDILISTIPASHCSTSCLHLLRYKETSLL